MSSEYLLVWWPLRSRARAEEPGGIFKLQRSHSPTAIISTLSISSLQLIHYPIQTFLQKIMENNNSKLLGAKYGIPSDSALEHEATQLFNARDKAGGRYANENARQTALTEITTFNNGGYAVPWIQGRKGLPALPAWIARHTGKLGASRGFPIKGPQQNALNVLGAWLMEAAKDDYNLDNEEVIQTFNGFLMKVVNDGFKGKDVGGTVNGENLGKLVP
ncbi:hypothetical protein SLS60_005925 [Paraconiothyrium brasiliense]|uniref:Uncharacterized protein n=1 Tax=Paraconiothyrium brasiliense TaxID=300254 RepID=A0ABR3RDK3_9PLEO